MSTLLAVLIATTAAHAAPVNKIVATVDGEPITIYQVKKYAERTLHRNQPHGGDPQRGEPGVSMDQSGLLEALITDTIIEKEVSAKGIIVRGGDIDHYIEGIKERNNLTDAQLKDALAGQGLTMESYRSQVREEIQKAQLINREIRGKVNVTPEEVQRYYEQHLSEYSTPEKIQVAHILFRLAPDAPADKVAALTAKAEEVYRQIKKGADFAEMAKQYSEDSSGQSGGILGSFKKGELLDDLEKAAARLKVGEVSEPVRTKVGIHILKLEAREGAAHEQLDALADQIKQQLYNAALEERFQKWLTEELRKRHHVEMHQ